MRGEKRVELLLGLCGEVIDGARACQVLHVELVLLEVKQRESFLLNLNPNHCTSINLI